MTTRTLFTATRQLTACATLFAAFATTTTAHAGWMDSLLGSSNSSTSNNASQDADASDTRKSWPLGEFSSLRLQPAEANAAPNRHPAAVSEALLAQMLSSIRLPKGKTATEALFSSAEVWRIVPALREALANASPGEDIVIQSSARRAENSLEAPTVVTARLFMAADGLHTLVNATRYDYYDNWRGTGKTPDFPQASRTATSVVPLQSPLAKNQAAGWLFFPMDAAFKTATLAPAPAAAPKAMPTPATSAPTTARTRDAAFFSEQEQRLSGLKSLRDKNLITEAEYQQKRGEILQGL